MNRPKKEEVFFSELFRKQKGPLFLRVRVNKRGF